MIIICFVNLSIPLIGGYLDLGEVEGWHEGHDPKLGSLFTRYILFKYFFEFKNKLGASKTAIEKTVHGLSHAATLGAKLVEGKYLPTESRLCVDSSVVGWQKHAISRLVGNLGSFYDPSKACFEILINSAGSSGKELCKPFSISIQSNERESLQRQQALASLQAVPSEIAHFTFYASSLKKPKTFLEEHKEKLGPNSSRLLTGLAFLENVSIPAQKVGNCWLKQPIRCLLTNLYIELLTHRAKLSPEQAWYEAKEIYKDIQTTIAIPFIYDLIQMDEMSIDRKQQALRALEIKKESLAS